MRPHRVTTPPGTLAQAYLLAQAASFFPLHFRGREDRLLAVRAGAERPIDAAILSALRKQNQRYAPSPARERNLDALGRGAAAVLTGQQVGLFLGPLFTIYKAATAIRFAEFLSEESGHPVVPIFWLQTEDHDLPEIARFWLPDREGRPTMLEIPHDPENRRSVAHLELRGIEEPLEELREILWELPHGETHLGRLEKHYREGVSISDAFAGLLAELFAEEGLILIDPRDEAFAKIAGELHRRALEESDPIAERLGERARAIEAAGFPVAVHVREGAPLAFFHPEGREGPRFRLAREGSVFAEVGGKGRHSQEQLLRALEVDPLRFSTSALLRPLLQDHLLPTAAYVGGPGEIAYFAQLAPLYEHFGRPMPLLVPRAQFRILDRRVLRRLERLGFREEEIGRDEAELLAHLREEGAPSGLEVAHELLGPFVETLEKHAPALRKLDPSLERAIRRTRFSVERAVSRFSTKVARSHLRKSGETREDLRFLKDFLRPMGMPQERCHGLSYYAARFGERAFVRAVLGAVSPLDPASRPLTEMEIERA